MQPKAASKARLIVEGRDDKHAIINLLESNGLQFNTSIEPRMPYVHDADGVDRHNR